MRVAVNLLLKDLRSHSFRICGGEAYCIALCSPERELGKARMGALLVRWMQLASRIRRSKSVGHAGGIQED